MSDILDQAKQIVAESPAHRAQLACDRVARFVRHGQIDGAWGDPLDTGQLLMVSQYTLPTASEGGHAPPVYLAIFLCNMVFTFLALAERDGSYVKLPPDAAWGHAPTVG